MIYDLISVFVSIMALTTQKWYILKVFKHVINQINHETNLDTLSVDQIRLLRKRLYLIKDRSGVLFTNRCYFLIIILDAIGLIIAFYSVVAFGFTSRISSMLLFSIILLIFKLTSAWFLSEISDQVINNNLKQIIIQIII